jgi:hypothetical protein
MRIAILFMLLLTGMQGFSQAKKDEIDFVKNFWGYKFYQNGTPYNAGGIQRVMESNTQAHNLMKQARGSNTVAGVIGFFGGALMGWPVGAALAGEDMDWGIFAAGAGLTAVSIPFSISGVKKMKKAVETWNSSLAMKEIQKNNFVYELKVSPGKVGLTVSF